MNIMKANGINEIKPVQKSNSIIYKEMKLIEKSY